MSYIVDTLQTGPGNLEMMVNDGTIPCTIQMSSKRIFRASFVPKEPIAHWIQMKFNGKHVQGRAKLIRAITAVLDIE